MDVLHVSRRLHDDFCIADRFRLASILLRKGGCTGRWMSARRLPEPGIRAGLRDCADMIIEHAPTVQDDGAGLSYNFSTITSHSGEPR
jgi:hypothetical protein